VRTVNDDVGHCAQQHLGQHPLLGAGWSWAGKVQNAALIGSSRHWRPFRYSILCVPVLWEFVDQALERLKPNLGGDFVHKVQTVHG
jgi:hypothetical protein